jgi:hypothetical protein
VSWWLLLFFPVIAALSATIMAPFIFLNPIVLLLIVSFLSLVVFIIVWKRFGKKDKQE